MKPTTAIPYGRISLFFVFILVLLTWGFYKTYLMFFPSFTGFTFIQHFHGAMMLTWMIMLTVQPLLILFRKQPIHRFIGRLSFIIAPVVTISIFLAAKSGFYRAAPIQSLDERIAGIALPIPLMVAFAIFYCLAILNLRNTYNHMRYMIGTGILMIGPGLGRALITNFDIPFPNAVNIVTLLTMGIAAILLLNDLLRKRSYTANGIVLVVLTGTFLLWLTRYSQLWHKIGNFIAENMF